MSFNSLKRDAMRVKQIAGIDFDFIDYEAAISRHIARLNILIADKIVPELERSILSERSDEPSNSNTNVAIMGLMNKADVARKLLGDDTLELWKKDQRTIETYKFGRPKLDARTEPPPPFGETPKEMLGHYLRYEKAERKNKFDWGGEGGNEKNQMVENIV